MITLVLCGFMCTSVRKSVTIANNCCCAEKIMVKMSLASKCLVQQKNLCGYFPASSNAVDSLRLHFPLTSERAQLCCHIKKQLKPRMAVFTEKLMYIFGSKRHLIPWGVLFCLLARINSSSIFGRRVLFLAAKTGTPFHFFLLKVEWGAIFGPFRFWHDRPLLLVLCNAIGCEIECELLNVGAPILFDLFGWNLLTVPWVAIAFVYPRRQCDDPR